MILVSPFLTVRVEQVRGGGQVSGQVSGLVWIRNSTQSFYLSRAERRREGLCGKQLVLLHFPGLLFVLFKIILIGCKFC